MITPGHILKEYFGFNEFRTPQEEIIQAVLDGKDTLALLPTGGGKSVCFQVPGLMQTLFFWSVTLIVWKKYPAILTGLK